jgi:hypothetical protein
MEKPKKNKREIFEVIAILLEVAIPVAVAVIALFIDSEKFPLENKIALLAIGLGASVLLLQLTVKFNHDSQKENEKERDNSLKERLDSLHAEIELDEVYKKFLNVDDKLKPFIRATLESNNNILKKYIDEKRTGALELSVYYAELHKCADQIIADKAKVKGKYSGEIWALSCFLEDEWVDSGFEGAWVAKLLEADQKGVPTRRLYIFPDDKINLLKTSNDQDEISKFLATLKPYYSSNGPPQYKSTTSFAIARNDFQETALHILGKGFFAIKLSDGSMTLIRDVSKDNLSSKNILGGEVDFNEKEKQATRKQWELVIKAATPLDRFLFEKVNPSNLTKGILKKPKI